MRTIDAEVHTALVEEEMTTARWYGEEAPTFEERLAEGLEDEDDELHTRLRFLVEPGDLSPEVMDAVEPGAWDLVVLWAPMPWSEVPELPTHWPDHHVRGASFGAVPLFPGGADLEWLLRVTLPLLSSRAGPRFEVPDRLVPVWLSDGRYFDARSWSRRAHPLRWFGWVFAEVLPPAFWTEATGRSPTLLPASASNLAPAATPSTSRDVSGAEELNDSVLALGPIPTGARQDSIAARPPDGSWFGLTFDRMQRVDRVVAHLDGIDAASVEVTQDGETWATLARIEPIDTPEVVFSFDPTPVFAVRVRVDVERPDVIFACREIEVHRAGDR